MAFRSFTDLIDLVIRRLRQTPGPDTQFYSQTEIGNLLKDTYAICRDDRYWDHLTGWSQYTLDGTTGLITGSITGIRSFNDISGIYYKTNSFKIPRLMGDVNPYRLTGTSPRFAEPLSAVDDPTGLKVFRIWPMQSIGEIAIRARRDPDNLFTDPTVLVPFDETVLVNGTAAKYAASDGNNPADISAMTSVYNMRMDQLRSMHGQTPIDLDPRMSGALGNDRWEEHY